MLNRAVFLLGLCLSTDLLGGNPGFIENKNQWSCGIDFVASIPGGHMVLRPGQFSYSFIDYEKINGLHDQSHTAFNEINPNESYSEAIAGRTVNVNFLNSNPDAVPKASNRYKAYYNYFLGSDPTRWASKVYAYEEIIYASFYNGIDLKLFARGHNIKYDFVVSPGADPDQIKIVYAGARSLLVKEGDLIVDAEFAEIMEKKPIAYQWVNGTQRFIAVDYALENNQLSFYFPDGYDPCYELTIDPLIIFSTYSGFTADNWGSTATPGENGKLYSAGVTNETTFGGDFPAFNAESQAGPFQVNYGGAYDVAIFKYDSAGQEMLYASFLGGSDSESPHSLIVNEADELIVLGTTSSFNYPTTSGVIDPTFNGGGGVTDHVVRYNNGSDIFVAKISKDGSQLLASTFLGGSNLDGLNPSNSPLVVNYGDQLRGDIITDQQGDIFISTVTSSVDFPVQNSFNTTHGTGGTDAVVMKLSSDLTQILWGAFLGGSGMDASHTIKFDSQGNILVAGGTASANFPATVGSYQQTLSGNVDGWIAKLKADGSGIITATFTGTSSFDQVYFLDLNSNDEVYVYGQTSGPFPVTPGVYNNPGSGQFLQKLSSDLTTLKFSTVFGSGIGIPNISPTAFLVNDCNNIYMTGWGGVVNQNTFHWNSNTLGMPVSGDAFQSTTSGSDFYFMVLTEDATEFLYGTYMGGSLSRTHVDGGTSRFDKSGIVYHAVCSGCAAFNAQNQSSSDFPTTANAWSRNNNSQNCNNAAFKFDLSSLRARIVTNSIKLDQPGIKKICYPDKIVFQNRSTGGQFYEWDFGDGTSEVKADTVAIVHQYQKEGNYLVKLRAVDQGTCVGEDFDYVTITVNKAKGWVGEDQTICFGAEVQLQAGGGSQYEWTRTTKDSLVSQAAQPFFSPKDTTRYFVSVTDVNNCVVNDTVNVNVVPRIELQFEFEKVANCMDRASIKLLNNTATDEEQFFDLGDDRLTTERQVTHTYEADGNYRIRLVGKREFCVFEESVELPFFTIRVPNVITPGNTDANSAGKNDTFRIIYGDSEDSPTTTEAGLRVSLVVYNRWGKLAYQNKNYDDSWAGEGLEAGTYYYEAEIENEPTCKGWIQIIR